MPYTIKRYILIEDEPSERPIYDNFHEAHMEAQNIEFMGGDEIVAVAASCDKDGNYN